MLSAMDALFGWLLALPREATVLALALMTSFGMALVRKGITDQPLLARCARDLARLKSLVRSAKRERDRLAVRRMQSTMATVRLMQLRAEGRVLLVSLVPLGLLGWWGLERLEFLPLRTGESFTLTVRYERLAVDRLTHLVPDDNVVSQGAVVRVVQPDPEAPTAGVATWTLSSAAPIDAPLTVRCDGRSIVHPVSVGRRVYGPPRIEHGDPPFASSEIDLRPALLFGTLPNVPALGLASWMIGYLALTLLLLPVSRRAVGAA